MTDENRNVMHFDMKGKSVKEKIKRVRENEEDKRRGDKVGANR